MAGEAFNASKKSNKMWLSTFVPVGKLTGLADARVLKGLVTSTSFTFVRQGLIIEMPDKVQN